MKILYRVTPVVLTLLFLFASPALAETIWAPDDGVAVRQVQNVGPEALSAANSYGDVLTVWRDARDGDQKIYGQLLNPAGEPQWEENGRLLADATGEQIPSGLVANGTSWVLVWQDSRHEMTQSMYWDLYAQRISPSGDPLWQDGDEPALGGVPVAIEDWASNTIDAATVVNGPGQSVYVVWTVNDNTVYANRLMATGDVHSNWPDNGLLLKQLTVPGYVNSKLQVTQATDGDLLVGYSCFDDYLSAHRFLAHRVDPFGVQVWQEGGLDVTMPHFDLREPQMVSNGDNGVYACWVLQTPGELFAQRLDANGESTYSNPGGLLLTEVTSVYKPKMIAVPDEQAAIIAWTSDSGTNDKVYAQKFDGVEYPHFLWYPTEILVSDDSPTLRSIHGDGLGGAIVLYRTDGARFQHLSSDGELLIPEPFTPLHETPHVMTGMSMAVNSNGDVVISESSQGDMDSKGVHGHVYGVEQEAMITPVGGVDITTGDSGTITSVQSTVIGPWLFTSWIDSRYSVNTPFYQAQHRDTGETLFEENGMPVFPIDPDDPESFRTVSTAATSDGHLFAAAQYFTSPYDQVRLQKLTTSGDHPWGADGVTFTIEPGDAIPIIDDVSVLPGPDGSAILFFIYLDEDFFECVGAQRIGSDGAPMWSEGEMNFRSVSPPDGTDHELRGAQQLGNGNYAVYWKQTGQGASTISVQILSPEGELVFDEASEINTGESSRWSMLTLENDVVVAWFERIGFSPFIRAQRIGSDGNPVWAEPATLLESYGSSSTLQIGSLGTEEDGFWMVSQISETDDTISRRYSLADGSPVSDEISLPTTGMGLNGLEILILPDNSVYIARNVTTMANDQRWDIEYTRVQADGNLAPGYETGFLTLCDAIGLQRIRQLQSDGVGGTYAVWEDERGFGYAYEPEHLYTQRIHDNIDSVSQDREPALAGNWALHAAYPNPFNGTATVSLTLPQTGELHLALYDVLGREVMTLRNGRIAAGDHRIALDASTLASGMYFLRARVDGHGQQIQKLMLLR